MITGAHRRPLPRQAGNATVLVLGWLGVISTLAVAASVLAALIAVQHQADSAADLAALSAASHVADEAPGPCVAAARVAGSMGVEVGRCVVVGLTVAVDVRTRRTVLGQTLTFAGHAEAGPAEPEPSS